MPAQIKQLHAKKRIPKRVVISHFMDGNRLNFMDPKTMFHIPKWSSNKGFRRRLTKIFYAAHLQNVALFPETLTEQQAKTVYELCFYLSKDIIKMYNEQHPHYIAAFKRSKLCLV